MISSCHGLDHLKAVPFPSDYIDPFSRAGKATHMDKPGPIEERQYLPGECWHWDTMGPTTNRSFAGHQYCTIFVDDATGYCMIYTHANRQLFTETVFKQFLADIAPLRARRPVLCFRRDGAGENTSKEIEAVMRNQGIRSEKSTPHEPNQNGIPERKIRTLTDIARTNLIAS